jgi:cyclic di-GMP phosphodiesterase
MRIGIDLRSETGGAVRMIQFGPRPHSHPGHAQTSGGVRIPRVLVVDDDEGERAMYTGILSAAGCHVESAADGFEALSKLDIGFDLIALDADMPGMDGFEMATRIRSSPKYRFLPIIMVTGLPGPVEQQRAIAAGVNDFVIKPVDPGLFELRCRWLINLQKAGRTRPVEPSKPTDDLRRAMERASEAERGAHEAHLDTVFRLMLAAEYKDPYPAAHVERIGLIGEILMKALDFSPGEVEKLKYAIGLHDIGNLAVPDRILLKTGPLDPDEWEVMRSHTTLGAELLAGSRSPLLQLGSSIALTHHEAWNGTGYPHGLRGEDIPIEGRLCAVVDVFVAVTTDRPHRPAFPIHEAFGMMACSSGERFDPEIINAFLDIRSEIDQAHATFDRPEISPEVATTGL